MMKILFVHQSSDIGGGSFCLLNVVKSLDKTLWKPVVALKTEGELTVALRSMGVMVVLFPQMANIPYCQPLWKISSLKAYFSVVKSFRPFRVFLQQEKIDVVYLNNMMLAPYLMVTKRAGCKTVMHVREHWMKGRCRCQLEWIRKIVYDNCDCLIAINRYSASIFPKLMATIVYDWIDMSTRYQVISLNNIFKEDVTQKKVLLFTGGQSSIKGTDYVVEAFSNVVKGEEYRLLILGIDQLNPLTGWKHMVKLFLERFGYYYYDRHLQEMLMCDDRVKYIPAMYGLSSIIEQAHCFVSYFRIPHANLALAENIIMGKPCIAADTEEAQEYSGQGRYAKLVKPMNSVEAFSLALKDFLVNIAQWQKVAQEGSPVIEEMFSPNRNIKALNNRLGELIAS